MSWAQYHARSERLGALLVACGVAPGECVAVLLPDGPGVHVAFVGIEKAGAITMGIGPRAGRDELLHLLRRSAACALITRPRYRDLDMRAFAAQARASGLPLRHCIVAAGELACEEPLEVDGEPLEPGPEQRAALAQRAHAVDDVFLLNPTSGTTGLPKCVAHDQARWNHFHALAVEAAALTSDDVFLSAIPAPFGFGLWTAHFTPTLLGAPCIVMPRFEAAGLARAIERHRVSVLAAVSTQFVMLLNEPEARRADLSSLRVLFTGGEAVPYERALEFEERTGASVLQFYGSNETGALSRTTLADPREKRLRTAGRPIDSMQVRLLDASGDDVTHTGRGQPACRGPLLSRGYHADPQANAALYTPDGWMRTGDVATLDEEGYLAIAGRAGDFIIRGGRNVSAAAVEQAVLTHPDVALAAAVAMPDPVFGEKVCVYVEARPGACPGLEALVAHLRARGVSSENLPERLVVLDAIPRSSGGKVAKGALREDIRRRLAAEGVDGR